MQTPEPRTETTQLTASQVLQRTRGCGEREAIAILNACKADHAAIVRAYAGGADAVEAVLNVAADADHEESTQFKQASVNGAPSPAGNPAATSGAGASSKLREDSALTAD